MGDNNSMNFTEDEDLLAFLNYLKDNRNYSDLTIRSYQIDVRHFLSFLQEENIPKKALQRGDIRAYLLTLQKRGSSLLPSNESFLPCAISIAFWSCIGTILRTRLTWFLLQRKARSFRNSSHTMKSPRC